MSNFQNENEYLEAMNQLQTKFNELNTKQKDFNKKIKGLYKQHILIFGAVVLLDNFLENVDFPASDQSVIEFCIEQLKELSHTCLFGCNSQKDDDLITVDLI